MAKIAVTRQQLDKGDRNLYFADASTLGLAPGQWPLEIEADLGTEQGDGSPVTFELRDTENFHGETTNAFYATRLNTAFLRVYND